MSTISSAARRRRRGALAAVLALVAAPLFVTSGAEGADATCPDPAVPCVIVKVVSIVDGKKTETKKTVAIAGNTDLPAQEDQPLDYKRRSKEGGKTETVKGINQALSIRKILDDTNADDWRFSETPNAGVPSTLAPGATYEDSLVPAVYLINDNQIGYVRPLTGTDDVNAGDVFVLDRNQSLVLTVHTTGDLLEVDFTSSPKKKVTTKTPVTFTSKVTPSSRTQKYYWNFTGGTKTQDKTAAPTHPYTKQGRFAVNLEVRDPDDGSYGRAATKTVKVGKPKAPSTGGSGSGSGGGTGGGGGSGYIPPSAPNSSDVPADEAPPTDDLPTAPVDDGLQEVEGFVLAGAGSEQGDSIPGTEAAAQPTEASELSTKRKISGAAIGTLAVLLLLGLGAEIETRWLSTRLVHLRRRA